MYHASCDKPPMTDDHQCWS